jgi:hypothetical protein
MEDESRYHAVTNCITAEALRQEASKVWNLPPDRQLAHTGNEWGLTGQTG